MDEFGPGLRLYPELVLTRSHLEVADAETRFNMWLLLFLLLLLLVFGGGAYAITNNLLLVIVVVVVVLALGGFFGRSRLR